MADRTLSIQFDEKGRPTQLSRSNGSSVAGIVTAVASASAAVRDEYATGLAKIVEIQSNRQKLAMQDINNQIERLQKEKDLVAAKLASASASQSFDLVLQQNQLVAELGLLKARLDVETAQGTYDQAVELARLKADLEQLKTQLEVVKTKLAIEEAKKGGGS
jgi:hypothetical protein